MKGVGFGVQDSGSNGLGLRLEGLGVKGYGLALGFRF